MFWFKHANTKKHVSKHSWLSGWVILNILAHLAHLAQSYFSLIISDGLCFSVMTCAFKYIGDFLFLLLLLLRLSIRSLLRLKSQPWWRNSRWLFLIAKAALIVKKKLKIISSLYPFIVTTVFPYCFKFDHLNNSPTVFNLKKFTRMAKKRLTRPLAYVILHTVKEQHSN